MQDYFVSDTSYGDGAVVDAPSPVDAAQKFIDIVQHNDPNRTVAPRSLNVYPLRQRNRLIDPLDMTDTSEY